MRLRRFVIHRPRAQLAALPKSPPVLMRWDVINELLTVTKRQRFLEIGVQNGVCGARVNASEKWGVDPKPMVSAGQKYDQLSRLPSDAFFAQLKPDRRFDVVLVDGLHHAVQVERDVDNALRHLSADGVIVLHDCNPQSEPAQRVPRETGVWNGDCWKAMVALRARGDLDAFTIDADHGIGIVRRRAGGAAHTAPGALTYEALERDREALLGLVPSDRWAERFGAPLALGKVAVVSAIYGGRDTPRPAPQDDLDEYLLFTDGEVAEGWTKVPLRSRPKDSRAAARKVKTLALDLVDADVVLWVDGRIRVRGWPLRPLLRSALRRADVASYPHPWRDCAYAEAVECGQLGLAPTDALGAQAAAYRDDGLLERSGLWNTMVVARRRTEATVALGRAWWDEVQRHTLRDQVSLPYVLWQADMTCAPLGDDVYHVGSSSYFTREGHAREM